MYTLSLCRTQVSHSYLLAGKIGGRGIYSSAIACSKWSKIKHGKGIEDGKRGAVFSKAAIAIVSAAKTGGSVDPEVNTLLAIALKNAKNMGVPKENVANALHRATNPSPQDSLQNTTYEAMGPAQVALIIECMTDNPARTAKIIREILSKNGARLAPVSFMFNRKGLIRLTPQPGSNFDDIWEAAVEGGAEEVEEVEREDGSAVLDASTEENVTSMVAKDIEIITSTSHLSSLSTLLSSPPHSHTLNAVELAYLPSSTTEETGATEIGEVDGNKLRNLVEVLEDNADCVRVWTST